MKRVLLTGATGFIGRYCAALLLARGYEVHAVSSRILPITSADVQWHQADLFDLMQAEDIMQTVQPTHMLHLAWYAVPGKFWNSSENLRWVQATLYLLQEFARHGGQRVVMAGTCAEYDWRYGYCSEQVTPLLPTTLYGVCKHSLQIMLAAFADRNGLSAAWGRVFFLYGPYEYPDRLVASVIRSLLKGEPARCSHGNQVRDVLYVEDVASAFTALLDSKATGVFNIASGLPIALKDVVLHIADLIGKRDLVQLGALPPPVGDPPLLVGDINRLTQEIGWSPAYDLNTGLENTIHWWKEYLH